MVEIKGQNHKIHVSKYKEAIEIGQRDENPVVWQDCLEKEEIYHSIFVKETDDKTLYCRHILWFCAPHPHHISGLK